MGSAPSQSKNFGFGSFRLCQTLRSGLGDYLDGGLGPGIGLENKVTSMTDFEVCGKPKANLDDSDAILSNREVSFKHLPIKTFND